MELRSAFNNFWKRSPWNHSSHGLALFYFSLDFSLFNPKSKSWIRWIPKSCLVLWFFFLILWEEVRDTTPLFITHLGSNRPVFKSQLHLNLVSLWCKSLSFPSLRWRSKQSKSPPWPHAIQRHSGYVFFKIICYTAVVFIEEMLSCSHKSRPIFCSIYKGWWVFLLPAEYGLLPWTVA